MQSFFFQKYIHKYVNLAMEKGGPYKGLKVKQEN